MNNYNGIDDTEDTNTIQILIETNSGSKDTPLTFSIFSEKYDKTGIQISSGQFPYFAPSIIYPAQVLANMDYSTILTTFFNKQSFIQQIVNNGEKTNDYAVINENLILMLNLLFPNTYPIQNNITTSFDKYLNRTKQIYTDILRNKIKKTFYNDSDFEYAKINNGIISEIVWLNDIINVPLYKELTNKIMEYEKWRQKARLKYTFDKSELNVKLEKTIYDTKSDTYFTEDDYKTLESQNKVFDKDTMKIEMIRKINVYTESFDPAYNIMVTDMIIYFIGNNDFKKMVGFMDFENAFDFKVNDDEDLFAYFETYNGSDEHKKNIQELNNTIKLKTISFDEKRKMLSDDVPDIKSSLVDNQINAEKALASINKYLTAGSVPKKRMLNTMKKDVEIIISSHEQIADLLRVKPLFGWKSVTVKSTTTESIKNELKSQIAILKRDLWDSVQKYNDFQRITSREITESRKSAKLIDEIITEMKMIQKPENKGKINVAIKVQSIMDKVVALKQNYISLRSIDQKLQKIAQIINEMNGLDVMFRYILNAEGIFYKYKETKLDTVSNQKSFNEEIVKEKYKTFVSAVSYIRDSFLSKNVESMNPILQRMINEYLENRSSDFMEKIVKKIYEIENPKKDSVFIVDNYWNISVLKNSKIKDDNAGYTARVYMEVITGDLNPNTMSKIKCQYTDSDLVKRFTDLTMQVKTYNLVKRPPFNIDSAIQVSEKKARETEDKIKSVKNVTKVGGYTRKMKKNMRSTRKYSA
jgi:hypothetical protein